VVTRETPLDVGTGVPPAARAWLRFDYLLRERAEPIVPKLTQVAAKDTKVLTPQEVKGGMRLPGVSLEASAFAGVGFH